ncbi:MAG: hypothetical protein OXM87_08080 [Truepera sp.]|nr:hypothetical protein [Truepera sp.]
MGEKQGLDIALGVSGRVGIATADPENCTEVSSDHRADILPPAMASS